MQPKASLPYSQDLTIVPYSEPQICSSHPYILIYKACYNIILQFMFYFSQVISALTVTCLKFILGIYL